MKTMSKTNKIQDTSAKDAAILSMNYLRELLDPTNILLEEIELSRDKKFWNITLSYDSFSPKKPEFHAFIDIIQKWNTKLEDIKYNPNRSFKTFKVNRKTGIVESMKIRELA